MGEIVAKHVRKRADLQERKRASETTPQHPQSAVESGRGDEFVMYRCLRRLILPTSRSAARISAHRERVQESAEVGQGLADVGLIGPIVLKAEGGPTVLADEARDRAPTSSERDRDLQLILDMPKRCVA